MFRYRKTGEIWYVKRQGGKVAWRNLKTKDLNMARAKLQTWPWKQAQKVIDHYVKEYQIDEPEDSGHPAAATAAAPHQQSKAQIEHTLAECFASWERTWSCSQGTRATRGYRWKMLCRVLEPGTPVSAITITRLKEVQARLRTELSPVTVNDVMGKVLRLCLDHAVETGWLPENPALKLKPLKRDEVIRQQPSWEEAWRLVEEAERQAPESGELLRFILSFGVGQAEVKKLQGEHFDLERNRVGFVRKKTGKLFWVPILPHAKTLLEALLAAGRIKTGKTVFKWRDPEQALHGACERLKTPVYSLRALRRTFIIHCLESNVEVRTVAKWQGHRNAKLILDTYGAYVSPEHEQAQIAKLSEKK